jgi:secreted PhoX family phosphatase
MRTMFLNIQHPGETPSDRSDPADPGKFSSWPGAPGSRPRSATVVVRKRDGGVIGS